MKVNTPSVSKSPAWKAIKKHKKEIGKTHIRTLFQQDPDRAKRMTLEAAGLFMDYSKNRATDQTFQLLLQLARDCGLRESIDAMFSGEKINITENRAVLHTALRAPAGKKILVDGQDVVPGVHEVLDRMERFSNRVRSGEWKGHTGKRIQNIVNVGIGG